MPNSRDTLSHMDEDPCKISTQLIKDFLTEIDKSALICKTRQSIQWTPGYTFEWKVVNKRLYKSNKNSLIPTYFLI